MASATRLDETQSRLMKGLKNGKITDRLNRMAEMGSVCYKIRK